MAKYLHEVHYTLDGIRGLRTEGGSGRVAALSSAIEGVGGKLESFYFAFGDSDAYLIVDYPDATTAAGAALAASATGEP
ncbi:MAG: GYD domain-containing protein [Acidimicrobiales bacterium]|jgi:uncharacterized protein with GYD domain